MVITVNCEAIFLIVWSNVLSDNLICIVRVSTISISFCCVGVGVGVVAGTMLV